MECLECNAINPDGATNCSRCGASLQPVRARLYLDRAMAALGKGRLDFATVCLSQADVEMLALSQAERDHYLLTARAFLIQGAIYYANGQMPEARAEILLAVTRLEQQPTGNEMLSQALGRLGNISYYLGEIDKAIEYYQRSGAIAAAAGSHIIAAKTLTNLGNMHLERGEVAQAQTSHAAALAQARLSADPLTQAEIYRALGWFYANYGPYSRALDCAAQALDLVPQVDKVETRSIIIGEAGYIHACYGNLEQARQYIYDSYILAQQGGSEIAKEHAATALAELIRQRVTPEAWFDKAMRSLEGPAHRVMLRWEASLCQAIYYVSLGDKLRMRRELQSLAEDRTTSKDVNAVGVFDHAAALLYAALGEWEAATSSFMQARAHGRLSPYEQAMTWVEQGTMLQRRAEAEDSPGRRGEATVAFGEAIAQFRELGLPLRVAQVEEMLRGE